MDDILSHLRATWQPRAGWYAHDEVWGPGKFCALLSDEGGAAPCRVLRRYVAYFDSREDFLGWLAYAEIPRIYTWSWEKPSADPAVYMAECNEDERRRVLDVIAALESAAVGPMADPAAAVERFNELFAGFDPAVRVLAYGGTLEAFLRAVDQWRREAAGDEPELATQAAAVRELLSAGAFDEADAEHVRMARAWIDAVAG